MPRPNGTSGLIPTTGKPTPAFSWSDVDAAREAAGFIEDECPKGAFTAAQYAERYGLPSTTAQSQLTRMLASGKLATGHQWGTTARGSRVLIRMYWPA